MNLEKHVKTPIEQLAEAEGSLVPTHARGAHLVDRYIKGRKVDHQSNRSTVLPAAPQYILRFDRLPSTPTSLARIRKRVEEINRRLWQSDVPFRLRAM
jgi:hypothetical protein